MAAGAPLEDRLGYSENHTALHLAVELLDANAVRVLIEAGADVNSQLDLELMMHNELASVALGLGPVSGTFHVRPLHQVGIDDYEAWFSKIGHGS